MLKDRGNNLYQDGFICIYKKYKIGLSIAWRTPLVQPDREEQTLMMNGIWSFRPQYGGMQAQVNQAVPYAQTMPSVVQVIPAQQAMFSTMPSQSPMFGGFGNWFAPVTQSLQNSFAAGHSMLTGFGQASGNFFNSLGGFMAQGMGQGSPYMPAIQAPVSVYAPMAVHSPQSFPQVMRDMGQGAKMAVHQIGGILKEHAPVALALGGTIAASTAVCSFMGGAMVGTAGIAMAQHMMNNRQHAM